jgi:N-acetylglucosaminyl-diphospho-decaprenol L-rhamnosyltransferase
MSPSVSIIIVTYHCSPLTHLCLWSLAKSNLKTSEVIMIDNAGNDPLAVLLAEQYPFLRLIQNDTNEGFGRACNRGFHEAKGNLILFMNPDTMVPVDFEQQIIAFFETHRNIGAMGTYMMDGRGVFLEESKRNFPYPLASLLKFSGLNSLIPSQSNHLQYYATHISAEQTAPTEILSGAFMVVTREAMLKTSGFDPQFFLYSEDIDLSWQVLQSGFTNWYNGELKIVHFKSETTKKSASYSAYFYNSMSLFYAKYFQNKHSGIQLLATKQLIKLMKLFSFVKNKFNNQKSIHNPSHIYLHPDSCRTTTDILKSAPDLNVFFNTNHSKAKTHLLLSSQKTNPKKLIDLIHCSAAKKYKLLFWHEESGWLFALNGNKQYCQVLGRVQQSSKTSLSSQKSIHSKN